MRRLLCKDPSKRLTAAEALEHRWLLTAGQENLSTGHVDKIKYLRYTEKLQVRCFKLSNGEKHRTHKNKI